MVLEQFSAASLSADVNSWIEAATKSTTNDSAKAAYKTASFYQDSSGRSKVDLPLRLTFRSAKDMNAMLATKCIHPAPNIKEGEVAPWNERAGAAKSESNKNNDDDDDDDRYSFGVEAKVNMTSGSGEAVSATVESVNILSSSTEENVLLLETQLILRVSRLEDDGKVDNGSLQGVRLGLEVTAVLSEKSAVEDRDMAASVGLRALYLGRYADLGKTSARRVVHNRLDPITLQVQLSHAFCISARSMSGPNIGETLVSLAISHSNTHNQDVMISNLALHPAFSRSVKSGSQSDQSGAVQWGFAPGAQLKMPLKISPRQAHATILHILGSSETGQAYISPLSVTASVKIGAASSRAKSVVAAVEVEWESASQVPSNASSDALRVDVTVPDQDCQVGEPFAVKIRVHNLGQDHVSNLKIVVPRNTKEVENNFRILGVSGDDNDEENSSNGNSHKSSCDEGLLQVDDELPLEEIRSRESTEAEMRFIALRKGTLRLPHFEVKDFGTNRSFRCVHNVQVVAASQ